MALGSTKPTLDPAVAASRARWWKLPSASSAAVPGAATIMLVGEQPGDKEDESGQPFVGPAGVLLNRAFEAAGIQRRSVYVTNAVKHFNFVLTTGNRRLHEKRKIVMCLPVVVGWPRGRGHEGPGGALVMATFHPSALLRAPDAAKRAEMWRAFVSDLRRARELGARGSATPRRSGAAASTGVTAKKPRGVRRRVGVTATGLVP